MGAEVHVGGIPPDEEGLVVGMRLFDELNGPGSDIVVDGLHALFGQRAGIFNHLLADTAKARIHGRVINIGGLAMHHAARAKALSKGGILGVVGILRLFLGVKMVEVAIELVKAVDRGQELLASPRWFLPNCPVT